MRSLPELLQAGYQGNLTTPRDLQRLARLSTAAAAALCFVSKQTYRRWGRHRPANPTALRLLAIHAGYLPWEVWQRKKKQQKKQNPPSFNIGGLGPGDLMVI